MGQKAADKAEALRLLADRLVADGLVAEGYLQGLQAREAQGSTFLGQGIAIPMARRRPVTWCTPPACACCSFPRAWTGAMARWSIWLSASLPVPMSTCACCNC